MAASPSVLGKVLEVFERNFRDRGELGASVSIWWNGSELISEGHGWCEREKSREWTSATLVPVYSATKVPSAATLLVALETHGLSAATPVREVWPAFPVGDANFSHLLSHQCGLAGLDEKPSIFDHAAVVAAIESQVPAWALGEGHGYHPRTFGALVDEPIRRLTGKRLGECWREMIADPLGLDFWIGLPESEWPRVARLYPGKVGKPEQEDFFYQQMATEGTFTRKAFSSPSGLRSIQEMNDPVAWSAGLPALGGVGTASALAKFYQAVIGSIASPLSATVRHALATPVSAADDRVLLRPTVFTCGAQLDPLDASGKKIRSIFGPSLSAFGHPGAGGSHAFGDPLTGISFAYVMNQMNLGVMPGVKCLEMVDALFSEM
ncbi:MAG: serine hydrolase domain-containing protein [Luteolibacter sp.]|uniref:serine hydrolase domain-containing protein n=1 Tax=Luteolibacter sp. TaxID=1962973 RepID=UPI003263FF2C